MNYIWQSVKTWSYWKYAIISSDGIKTFFAVLGGFWMLFEILEVFHFIDKEQLPKYSLYLLLVASLIIVMCTRRPVKKISYRTRNKDLCIEVRIADLFATPGQRIISTNTTFDTDTATGIISTNSVQGQFTMKYYPTSIATLDSHITNSLSGKSFSTYDKISGKNQKYPIGTTVRVDIGPETFYLLAMSDLNYNNTAGTTLENVLAAVRSVFSFIAQNGHNTDIVIPLIGKGRGRLSTNRKSLIAAIAEEFIKASHPNHFANKLIIAIHPKDAENFEINLHEVRDLLNNYLP